jgi:hypothetical protein
MIRPRSHVDAALRAIQQFGAKRIALLGVAFKPGTADLRESAMLDLAERLIGKGYEIGIHDEYVNLSRLVGANREYLPLISAPCDRAVGRWDERFFLYSEETDYGARARAAGFRVEYMPTARARHRGGGSGQSSALLALNAVNRVRYMEKRRRLPRAYRAAVILHELLRCGDSGHRTALRFVLRRSS